MPINMMTYYEHIFKVTTIAYVTHFHWHFYCWRYSSP